MKSIRGMFMTSNDSSYTKYHKIYNETKQTRKFTMELSHMEHFSLYEYSRFSNKSIKALLLQALEHCMFNDIDFISFLVQSGNLSRSMKELYEAERKRLDEKQRIRDIEAEKARLIEIQAQEKLAEEQKIKEEEAREQELVRLKEIEIAKVKEIQARILNLKARFKASKEVETPVIVKKNEDKKPPLKNHRIKFLSGIAPAKPKEVKKPEKQVTVKAQPVKEPKQMSMLEEVSKLTEKEKVKPRQSKQPDSKLKNSKQGKPDDKQEFGPGSKGVSNSVGKTKKAKPKNNKK